MICQTKWGLEHIPVWWINHRWLRSLKFISTANCIFKVAESCANHVIGLFCFVQEPTESWLSHPSSKYAFRMYYFFIVAFSFKMLKVLLAPPPPPGPDMCSLSSSSPLLPKPGVQALLHGAMNCQFLCKEYIYRKIKSWLAVIWPINPGSQIEAHILLIGRIELVGMGRGRIAEPGKNTH